MVLPVLPKLKSLPEGFSTEGALRIELEEGVLIFRASSVVQSRIQDLLSKQQDMVLNSYEEQELDCYKEIDDYLSVVNRTVRNFYQQAS
jgi:hypothetical protein